MTGQPITPARRKRSEAVMRISGNVGRSQWGLMSRIEAGNTFMNYAGTQIALIAQASVDRKSGKVLVPKVWMALDPGIAVQPDNIVAQTESSVVHGLGFALSERITIDDGAVQQSNFYDYYVPRMNQIPEIF